MQFGIDINAKYVCKIWLKFFLVIDKLSFKNLRGVNAHCIITHRDVCIIELVVGTVYYLAWRKVYACVQVSTKEWWLLNYWFGRPSRLNLAYIRRKCVCELWNRCASLVRAKQSTVIIILFVTDFCTFLFFLSFFFFIFRYCITDYL